MKKLFPILIPLILFATIFLTWLLSFPYLLWAKEANGFFACTHDYFAWAHSQDTPFLSIVAGDWLTQLFRFPAVGALIQATVVLLTYAALQLLLRRLCVHCWGYLLSVVVAMGIWFLQFHEESLAYTFPALSFLLLLVAVAYLPRWWQLITFPLSYLFLPVHAFHIWMLVAVVILVTLRYPHHRPIASCGLPQRVVSLLIVAVCAVAFIYRHSDRREHLHFLVATERWEALSNLLGGEGKCENVDSPYLLLALSQQGLLGDYIFHYPVNSEEYYLYAGYATRDAYFFNQHFYAHLGLWNEAIHMAYQEKTRTRYPMSFRVLMSLVKLETARGDYRQASKYLDLLDRASFYHSWVAKHRPTAEQLATTDTQHDEATFFFTDSSLKNLHYAATIGHGNEAVQHYYLCALLIRKNLMAFVNHLKEHPEIIEAGLPNHYWEALILADAQGFRIDGLSMFPGLYERFMDFQKLLGTQDRETLLSRYKNTYWFNYYFLTFPEDQNTNPGIIRREQ